MKIPVGNIWLDDMTEHEVVRKVIEDAAQGAGGVIVTPNLSILRQALDPEIHPLVANAKIVTCDGFPVLLMARLAGGKLRQRVTGSSLIFTISEACVDSGDGVYVLGGPPGAAAEAAQRLRSRVTGLNVVGFYSPPMGFFNDESEFDKIAADIDSSGASIVFVGFGFPLQERLAYRLSRAFPQKQFLCCGAAIEFAAQTKRRAPRAIQVMGFEWAFRWAQEPRRLSDRYCRDIGFVLGLAVGQWKNRSQMSV